MALLDLARGHGGECVSHDGLAALQIITIQDDLFDHYRRTPDFIQKYIFPGGMLPSPRRLQEETERAGLAFAWVTVLALPINIMAGLFGMNVGGIPLAEL